MVVVDPGVLAFQGSVEPHVDVFSRLGHETREVRRPQHLDGVTHLVIPGGESTTLYHLLHLYGLWGPIQERGASGDLAIFGTCAGAILLGRPDAVRPPRLGLLDVTVERNAYGRQVDSFVEKLQTDWGDLDGVFIRAPRFRDIGPDVEVLGRHQGEPVLIRQERRLAASFHPELGGSDELHRRFLTL